MNVEKFILRFDCPVLAGHNKKLRPYLDNMGPFETADQAIPVLLQIPTLDIYSSRIEAICETHKIPSLLKTEVESFLEYSALFYLAGTRYASVSHFFSYMFKSLRPIEKQARKLRELLEEFEEIPEGFDYLYDLQKHYDGVDSRGKISLLFSRLQKDLIELESVSGSIKQSDFANAYKIGKAGPKGNPENQYWVYLIRRMWIEILNRDFQFDQARIRGRENFLRLAEDCFEVLYPGATEDLIRNTLELIEKDERRPIPIKLSGD